MALKTLANFLTEWSRILEDPNNERFSALLFYEGWNSASDYLVNKVPREWLKDTLEENEAATGTPDDDLKIFGLPAPTDSAVVRVTEITLQTGGSGGHIRCRKLPIGWKEATENSYFTSSATFPLYVLEQGNIVFLHAPSIGSVITVYYIKKPIDVALGSALTLPVALQRIALRMAVVWARMTDEEYTIDEMLKLWDAEIQLLGMKLEQ